jgi:hypothetical protein
MTKVNKEGQVWQKVDKGYSEIKIGDFVQIVDVENEAENGDVFQVTGVRDKLYLIIQSNGGSETLLTESNDGLETYVTPDDYKRNYFIVVETMEDSVPEVDTQEELTPCQKLGYKVGDKFEVLEDECGFEKGQIVVLYDDDKSDEPLFMGKNSRFTLCHGGEGAYLSLESVKKIEDVAVSPSPTESSSTQASEILRTAMNHLIERGITYDAKGGERSMSKVVQMFNTYKGSDLSVEDGWMFMVLLKMVRCSQGEFKLDNYEDGSAYFALAGEEAAQERGGSDDN